MNQIEQLIPEYFLPVVVNLRARAMVDNSGLGYGVIDVLSPPEEKDSKYLELGISHGFGHYSVHSVLIEKKPEEEYFCTLRFRDVTASIIDNDQHIVGTKIFGIPLSAAGVPSFALRHEEVANHIWDWFNTRIFRTHLDDAA